MSKHNITPEDIQTQIILSKIRNIERMTPSQRLDYVRKEFKDKRIALGRAIGFGLALVELMVYWQESPENLKDFILRHQELLEKYGSDLEEDKKQLMEWFVELNNKTGYSVISGWMEEYDD